MAMHPVVNASVTYTATIANPYTAPTQGLVSPTGTATFFDTYLGVTNQICAVPVTPGANGGISTSTCTESSNMLVGDHTITMTYSGDTNFTVATNPTTPTWVRTRCGR